MPKNESIQDAIERYFRGHATGDATHMRGAFLPTAHIEGVQQDDFKSWPLDEYCRLFPGSSENDERTRVRTIDLVDVSGNAGVAAATLIHGDTSFRDYFVLLRTLGSWRIANKVYDRFPTVSP